MYLSQSDYAAIIGGIVAVFVGLGIGIVGGILIGVPCGVTACLVSYCTYRCCKQYDKREDDTVNNHNTEVSIELSNEIAIDKLDLNEVTIVGGEVLEEVSLA
jgi:hypothetical protein